MAFTTTVGAGGTSLIGTSGVDTTTFAPGTLASAVFIGAQGDTDFVTLQTNQANNYTIRGGAGVDTITAAGFRNSLVTGDDGNDVITTTGTVQSATISGLEGNDTISVQSINGGIVNGNNGDDILSSGGAGTAASTFTNGGKLVGGQGGDAITLGAAFAVTLTSGLVNGQDGNDTIVLTNVAAMTFGGGSTIFGGQGDDTITSAAGAATGLVISGDLGSDTITTNTARDTIFGGQGADRITAGNGGDSVSGGAGVDTFTNTTTSSVAASASGLTGGGILAGETITFATTTAGNVDVITDFTAGAGGDIFSNGNGVVLATNRLGGSTTLAAATTYSLSGNYNASTGVFTVANNNGSDTLIITGTAADFTSVVANSVILQNVNVTQLVAANFA